MIFSRAEGLQGGNKAEGLPGRGARRASGKKETAQIAPEKHLSGVFPFPPASCRGRSEVPRRLRPPAGLPPPAARPRRLFLRRIFFSAAPAGKDFLQFRRKGYNIILY